MRCRICGHVYSSDHSEKNKLSDRLCMKCLIITELTLMPFVLKRLCVEYGII